MGKGLGSPLGITGVILTIIGIILAVIGIILLIVNQNNSKDWYIWVLMIGGLILALLGAIILAIAISTRAKDTQTTSVSVYTIDEDEE